MRGRRPGKQAVRCMLELPVNIISARSLSGCVDYSFDLPFGRNGAASGTVTGEQVGSSLL